jgi:hydroxypyruvate isomerase
MGEIKLSAPDWCFLKEGMDPASYYRQTAACGYAGVEMVDPERWAAARAAGHSVVTMSAPGMQEGLNNQRHHAALIPQVRSCLETAKASGIPIVVAFSGSRHGQRDDEGMAECITAFRELARDAERLGVTLGFEMLNAHDHPDYMADRSRFGFELARAVGSPRFKVVYDIYHMHRMGEDVLADLLGHRDAICHIHVAGSPRRDFPGTRQEIDYARIVREVSAAGYDGFWGQEFLPGEDDPLVDLEAAAMLFRRYARG